MGRRHYEKDDEAGMTNAVHLFSAWPAFVRELNEAHQKKFGRPADPIVGPAYACVQILADALAHAGALDREKVRTAIAATDMTTVVGPVKFRPDGTGIIQSVFVQWINGKQELVWPKDSATMPVVYPAPPFAKR